MKGVMLTYRVTLGFDHTPVVLGSWVITGTPTATREQAIAHMRDIVLAFKQQKDAGTLGSYDLQRANIARAVLQFCKGVKTWPSYGIGPVVWQDHAHEVPLLDMVHTLFLEDISK